MYNVLQSWLGDDPNQIGLSATIGFVVQEKKANWLWKGYSTHTWTDLL